MKPVRVVLYTQCGAQGAGMCGSLVLLHKALRLRIIDSTSLSGLIVRATGRVAGGVGWEGTAGAQGLDVELGVFPVLGSEIGTQSNLLVRLDDFLGNQRRECTCAGEGTKGSGCLE